MKDKELFVLLHGYIFIHDALEKKICNIVIVWRDDS